MKDDIPEELVKNIMLKCGRRCCICRRPRRTLLQVHHIREKSKGGKNDEDNLIVICLQCHTDVHTKVPFARRFTETELRGHRDALIKKVADEKLPLDDTDAADEATASVVTALRVCARPEVPTLPEAVEMLLAAVNSEDRQGLIIAMPKDVGTAFIAGGRALNTVGDRRSTAKYKYALELLEKCGLVEPDLESPATRCVTYPGYLVADELLARGPEALE